MSISREDFFRQKKEFELGSLTTESINIKSKNLSEDVKENVEDAVKILQEVDQDALNLLEKGLAQTYQLHKDVHETLSTGGRIFLSGCGATGRLSLAIETFWRKETGKDNVIGFMAGGDYALIRSVERFEDKMDYGARQLEELGFNENDLLLAVTEGGETSFVIGTALSAKMTSKRGPWFIYCNPDDELSNIKRSHAVIKDEGIKKLNLTVGAMAISGSTRMQATTAQMLSISFALFLKHQKRKDFIEEAKKYISVLRNLNFPGLPELIMAESSIYQANGKCTYLTSALSAITVLTDTTERSPTFSLAPFEKLGEEGPTSLAYLAVKGAFSPKEAWEKMLGREVRGLSWSDLDVALDQKEIHRFDVSEENIERRKAAALEISERQEAFELVLNGVTARVPRPFQTEIFNQIALKMALNILSTLIMGRIGRYEGNLMTYVRPSNFKLIDRAARYVDWLSKREGLQFEYDQIVNTIFDLMPAMGQDDPIVLLALGELKKERKN